ncbi:hypothetical protein PPERSA_08833 [Pseudocohnilembus persalinus]|uniref:Uncharacterized protein n=1 Tax=Pseudocohnilembus persalinus TaxID=266149 RepID=A0A0V0R3R0_PSEPJ|nr:hypothetical protein PPERSA_08833 [Pseudocohnilembus persalinus]|eukprot:KRX09117.1 hypothetical protein PPERSA_08833 [Pseudocohnilembus persalinus]
MRIEREENLYKETYRRIDVQAEFNCKNIDTPNIYGLNDKKAILNKVMISPYIGLPTIYGINSYGGVYFSGTNNPFAKKQDRSIFIINSTYKFNFQDKKKSLIKQALDNAVMKSQINYGSLAKEWRLDLEQQLTQQLKMSVKSAISQDGLQTSLGVEKQVNESNILHGELSFSGFTMGNMGLITQITPTLKSELNMVIQPQQVTIENNYTYNLNKRFGLIAGIDAQIAKQNNAIVMAAFINTGFQMQFNKTTYLEVKSHFGIGKNSLSVRLTRYYFNFSIPFNFSPYPSIKSQLIMGLAVGLGGYLGYKYTLKRQKNIRKQLHYINLHKFRLEEDKSHTEKLIKDLQKFVFPLVLEEILKPNGLVIVRSFIGHPFQIKKLRKFLKKKVKMQKYDTNSQKEKLESIKKVLLQQDNLDLPVSPDDIQHELQDITVLLISSMYQSVLQLDFTDLTTIKGLYNPCLNPKDIPQIFLMYILNDKLYSRTINFGENITIGANLPGKKYFYWENLITQLF